MLRNKRADLRENGMKEGGSDAAAQQKRDDWQENEAASSCTAQDSSKAEHREREIARSRLAQWLPALSLRVG
jgi:Skp family chaperone for outer membrane proteins